MFWLDKRFVSLRFDPELFASGGIEFRIESCVQWPIVQNRQIIPAEYISILAKNEKITRDVDGNEEIFKIAVNFFAFCNANSVGNLFLFLGEMERFWLKNFQFDQQTPAQTMIFCLGLSHIVYVYVIRKQ